MSIRHFCGKLTGNVINKQAQAVVDRYPKNTAVKNARRESSVNFVRVKVKKYLIICPLEVVY